MRLRPPQPREIIPPDSPYPEKCLGHRGVVEYDGVARGSRPRRWQASR